MGVGYDMTAGCVLSSDHTKRWPFLGSNYVGGSCLICDEFIGRRLVWCVLLVNMEWHEMVRHVRADGVLGSDHTKNSAV